MTSPRILRALAVLSAAALSLTLAAPASTAVGGCDIGPSAQVAIGQPVVHRYVVFGAACADAQTATATWRAYRFNTSTTAFQPLSYPGGTDPSGTSVVWTVRDTEPVGRFQWKGVGAVDTAGRAVAQSWALSDVRYSSRSTLEATRSGANDVLTIKARRYDARSHTYVAWANMPAVLELRQFGSGRIVLNFKVNASGNAVITLPRRSGDPYQYIAHFGSIGSTWGSNTTGYGSVE